MPDRSKQTPALSDGTVTRVAQQRRDPERVSVFIDDAFAFGLSMDLAAESGLRKGIVLSVADQRRLLEREDRFKARAVALNYVGYQARTVEEVRRKLRGQGFDDDLVEDAIQRLVGYGYLDDRAYARAYVQSKFSGRSHGPQRIATELLRRGVDRAIVDEVISDLLDDDDARAAATALAHKRWSSLHREPDERKRRRKVIDFLIRRGYVFSMAREIVEGIDAPEADAPRNILPNTSDEDQQHATD